MKGTGLHMGCTLTLSRDPSAAAQPAIALEFESPTSTESGEQHGSQQPAQRAAVGAGTTVAQRTQQGAREAQRAQQGGAACTGPDVAALGKRSSGTMGNLPEAGGGGPKRSRQDGSPVPPPPALPPAPPAAAGQPPPAHDIPLKDSYQMYLELKQALAGCGAPGGWAGGKGQAEPYCCTWAGQRQVHTVSRPLILAGCRLACWQRQHTFAYAYLRSPSHLLLCLLCLQSVSSVPSSVISW